MWVYTTKIDNEEQDLVSLWPPDEVSEYGLVREAVVGVLLKPVSQGGQLTPENFRLIGPS